MAYIIIPMILYADNTNFARRVLTQPCEWRPVATRPDNLALQFLMEKLYNKKKLYTAVLSSPRRWQYLMIVDEATQSHYDIMVELAQEGLELPAGVLCLAGHGRNFHGQRNRSWAGLDGNIHLVVWLKPDAGKKINPVGFTILSAVSVVETIDDLPGLKNRAGIKWVNDILIDGAKISGFLTHTQNLEGQVTGAILGIGLNVEATPDVPTDSFVSRTISLRDLQPDQKLCNIASVLNGLLNRLSDNYHHLETKGYACLLDIYRARNVIMGHMVEILEEPLQGKSDKIHAMGQVLNIGENLELFLDSQSHPVIRGRLRFKKD